MSGFGLKRTILAGLTSLICALGANQAAAQGLFTPVVQVNDDVVTEYEIEQRELFLRLLNSPGASRAAAVRDLVDERLRGQAIAAAGLELTQEAIDAGMEEFAQRANMNKDQFIAVLAQNGVSQESFRDFVVNGIAWRNLIRARFGSRTEISEAEIDRALAASEGASGIRVLVSEIIIPAPAEQQAEVLAIAEQIAASASEAEFSDYAREYSATASRDDGGRLPWQDLDKLPPVLRPLLLGLAPGEVTDPLPIPEAVALFQLRGIEETGRPSQQYSAIDYAAYYLAGGRSQKTLAEAEKIRARVDVCDDLYGVASKQPPEVLERGAKAPSDIPQDVALELSKLDPGEISTALTRNNGQTLVLLMMCGRTATVNESTSREDVAAALRNDRLNSYADGFLEQLRADARIVER